MQHWGSRAIGWVNPLASAAGEVDAGTEAQLSGDIHRVAGVVMEIDHQHHLVASHPTPL